MSLPTPTLRTDRLRLRPVGDADAGDLLALHSSARVLRYWDAPPWEGPERAARFVEASRLMAEEGTGARLALERAEDGAFLGWCGLTRWNPDHRSASLGYCLVEAAWGHGYATEAARAVLQWAFATLDLNRVQAETDTRNVASARVLEKLGFLREGTLREDCIVDGEVSDSWVFGLLRRDWQAAPGPGDAGGDAATWDLSTPAGRREALRAVDVDDPAPHHEVLLRVFDAERAWRESPDHEEVDGEEFEHVYVAAFLLHLIGDPADAPRLFAAKFRTGDPDLAIGFDAEAVLGAGREETLQWLGDHGYVAERDELAEWVRREDPALEDWARFRRQYFYTPDGVLLLEPLPAP